MSSSEGDDDDDDEQIIRRVENLISPYKSEYDVALPDFVKDDLRRRTQSCMICIERVKKTDPIWPCRSCRTPYHLHCVQRWARESSSRCFSTEDENETGETKKQLIPWCCPKCRCEYEPRNIPTEYRCFCGQVVNPKPDPWLVAHSCGGVCRRELRCGHQCVILCHPGFCPPCPKMVRTKCFCGKSDAQMKRCYDSKWSCQKTCNKKLACGIHRCSMICHEGECQTCTEKFVRKCRCGKKSEERPCSEQSWSCDTVCHRSLPCGRHECPNVCHDGACNPCVESRRRTCPCGKTEYQEGNCIDDLQCCGDTCGKLLDCNLHNCTDRCHRGPCSSCNQKKTKRCRCGLKEKEFLCGKEFLCEIKCKRKRQCGRHACNRRCCDGVCPPCEQTCGRSLQCGNHKCPQPCHRGPCFPCVLTSEVKCRCGKTVIKVPCGHERNARPPRCRNLCQIDPVCKHKEREPHRCHFGDCPPCRQVCLQELKCSHRCQSLCHTGLLVDVNSAKLHKASTPWEKLKPKFELVDAPCPPCQQLVPVTCLGRHETGSFHCCEALPYSCGRQCGRILSCGNHKCVILCHDVDSQACQPCDELCRLPRPNGCTHQCPKPCHPAPCPTCRQMVRVSCHCNLNQKFIPCLEWSTADETKRQQLQSCGNQCPRMMSCGHRCTYICHKGDCSNPAECSKKSTVRCPCGRRTSKGVCSHVQSGQYKISCDADCEKIKNAESTLKATKLVDAEGASGENSQESTNHVRRRGRKNKKRYETGDDVDEFGWKFYLKKYFYLIIFVGFLVFFGFILFLGSLLG